MKSCVIVIALSFLSSCAQLPPFDKEKNCSLKSLEMINKNQTLMNPEGMSGLPIFRAGQSCYNESLLAGYGQKHNVCVVIKSDANGKAEFLDAADRYNPMSNELKNCIENKLKSQDFSEHANSVLLWQIKLDAGR